jgi:transcriptional regulator with XRE-family HTH domain
MINHDQYVAEREIRDPAFREARERLRPMYEYRRAIIAARLAAGLSQKELAVKMGTTQSAVARLESGSRLPSVETLYKLAQALIISFTIAPTEPLAVHRQAVAVGRGQD